MPKPQRSLVSCPSMVLVVLWGHKGGACVRAQGGKGQGGGQSAQRAAKVTNRQGHTPEKGDKSWPGWSLGILNSTPQSDCSSSTPPSSHKGPRTPWALGRLLKTT